MEVVRNLVPGVDYPGRFKRSTSGSAARLRAASISGACAGRAASYARVAGGPASRGWRREGCCINLTPFAFLLAHFLLPGGEHAVNRDSPINFVPHYERQLWTASVVRGELRNPMQ